MSGNRETEPPTQRISNRHLLNRGDGLEVAELSSINMKAVKDTRVLVIDVPQKLAW